MADLYDTRFYDWVKLTAIGSARRVIPIAYESCRPGSVVDVGCGEGAWLSVWRELGVDDVLGFDGAHVNQDRLMLKPGEFVAADLSKPFSVGRRFDLAQSLEVAEHLDPSVADSFVAAMCALSDVVMFSAAVPGQGGEMHVNERRPSWWAARFRSQGYETFDVLRPPLREAVDVAPWYKFNTLVYANQAGQARLSEAALATRVTDLERLDGVGDTLWRLRCAMLAPLSPEFVSKLARIRYRVATAFARTAA